MPLGTTGRDTLLVDGSAGGSRIVSEDPPIYIGGRRVEESLPAVRIGDVLGGIYELREQIGMGGMGIVFEAHDRLLNRQVAIKVAWRPHPDYTLRKEGQALAAIRHPSMVTVHAMGEHRGLEYLVMERVTGVTLERHVRDRFTEGAPPTVAEAVSLLAKIADGLAAVHEAGISHRDVKPGNVMLAPRGRIVLMDFGLFCPEFQRAPTVAGSPEYMAPEVAMNRVLPGQGHLADIYAFGAVAFCLLTGRPPFVGEKPTEVFLQHVRSPVPDVGALRSDAPPELRRLIAELLAKRPVDRPQRIEQVLWQLRGLEARLPQAPEKPRFGILIVDDDDGLLETIRCIAAVAAPDAEIRCASDGESAVAAVRQRPPDLLLLDLNLPGMNGFELCMYLRGAGMAEQAEVVAMSAAAHQPDVALLEQLGVKRFLPKSGDLPDRLLGTIRELRRAKR